MKDKTGQSGKGKKEDRRMPKPSSEPVKLPRLPLFASPPQCVPASPNSPRQDDPKTQLPEARETRREGRPPENSTQLIQQLRRQQEALHESEERYRLAIRAANDAVWDFDLLTGALHCNETFAVLFGMPGETSDPWQWWIDRIHPEDRERMVNGLEQAMAGKGDSWTGEYRFRRKDGTWSVICDRAYIARDPSGKARRMIGAALDMTERKHAEDALLASKRNVETVLDSITDIYMAYDRELRFTDLNARAENELCKQAAEIIGKHFCDVFPEMKDGEDHRRYQAALSSGKPEHFEAHSITGKWYEAHAYPTDEGLSVYLKDITKRKQAEAALQDLNESLEQRVAERTAETRQLADELRALAGELSQAEQRERKRLASVLHDHIQQLLVAAKMQLNLLQRSDSDGIHSAAQSIESILNDAIAASRSLAVELSPPILHRAGLAPALGWLATRMEEKSLFKVHVLADSDAEPAAEPVRLLLFDSVRELLLNAIKYSGVTEAIVRMGRTPEGWTRIVVEDNGNGLDVATLKSRKDPGFGLFSIRHRLAYLGGRMEIESAPGRGTRVTLLAPPEPEPAAAPQPIAAAAVAARERPAPPQNGRTISILLVDDHELVRQGLSSLLQRHSDLDVVGAVEHGQKALELARQLRPDVVVAAVGVPGRDGLDLTRTIRAELPSTKVVGLSMHIEADVAAAMRKAGAAGYLTKGGPSADLIAAIRACAPRTQSANPA